MKNHDPHILRFPAFNTLVSLSVYADESRAQNCLMHVKDLCDTYERTFSRTLEGSDVSRINSASGNRTYVDKHCAELVSLALSYCAKSDGIFDITIGAVSKLWDMKRGIIPAQSDIEAALKHVDWRCIEVGFEASSKKHWVRLNDPHTSIDLGGIAKGWIADRLGEMLQDAGVQGYCIDLGGNVLVGGEKPDGKLWKIGLRTPSVTAASSSKNSQYPADNPNPTGIPPASNTSKASDASPKRTANTEMLCNKIYSQTLGLPHGSVVTSGIYERAFISNGKLYHHILDPKTGYPAYCKHASVSVVCERSIDAEGFSTTLLALDDKQANRLIECTPEIKQAIYQDFS